MKKDNRGETAKPIPGLVNNPKSTANHVKIQNTGSESKEMENQNINGSWMPPPKK
jgi:hypothetical protein